jgi:mono/diheme cytochrome c family protein
MKRPVLPLIAALMLAGPMFAVTAPAQEAGAPARTIALGQCFQCHTDAMFRDQRQDRRAWEATIYRMIGRGALWTPDEIAVMADYLATELGPDVKRSAAPR